MKQKLVVRLPMADAKTRSKALKIAVGVEGVISAAIEGNDKDQVVIVGDGVDSIHLTRQLRKRLGTADLVSVAAIDEKKKEPEKKPEPIQVVLPYQYHTMAPQHYIYEQPRDYNQESCSIM